VKVHISLFKKNLHSFAVRICYEIFSKKVIFSSPIGLMQENISHLRFKGLSIRVFKLAYLADFYS